MLRTKKIESNIQLFNYLKNYPLFGYKYFTLINLDKIHNLVLNKNYKTIKGKLKIANWLVICGMRIKQK